MAFAAPYGRVTSWARDAVTRVQMHRLPSPPPSVSHPVVSTPAWVSFSRGSFSSTKRESSLSRAECPPKPLQATVKCRWCPRVHAPRLRYQAGLPWWLVLPAADSQQRLAVVPGRVLLNESQKAMKSQSISQPAGSTRPALQCRGKKRRAGLEEESQATEPWWEVGCMDHGPSEADQDPAVGGG